VTSNIYEHNTNCTSVKGSTVQLSKHYGNHNYFHNQLISSLSNESKTSSTSLHLSALSMLLTTPHETLLSLISLLAMALKYAELYCRSYFLDSPFHVACLPRPKIKHYIYRRGSASIKWEHPSLLCSNIIAAYSCARRRWSADNCRQFGGGQTRLHVPLAMGMDSPVPQSLLAGDAYWHHVSSEQLKCSWFNVQGRFL